MAEQLKNIPEVEDLLPGFKRAKAETLRDVLVDAFLMLVSPTAAAAKKGLYSSKLRFKGKGFKGSPFGKLDLVDEASFTRIDDKTLDVGITKGGGVALKGGMKEPAEELTSREHEIALNWIKGRLVNKKIAEQTKFLEKYNLSGRDLLDIMDKFKAWEDALP